MYNTKVVCTYNLDDIFEETDKISEYDKDFVRNAVYRQELCDIFGMEEFDESTACKIIEDIYHKIKDYSGFNTCLEKVSKLYPLTMLDETMSLMCLYSYTYLFLTHKCVSEFLDKNKISNDTISKLLKELDKENNKT
jgi:hypothetical protein